MGECQGSLSRDQFFAVSAASSFNGYLCNFGLDLLNISYDPFIFA